MGRKFLNVLASLALLAAVLSCGGNSRTAGGGSTIQRASNEKIDVLNQPEKMRLKVVTLQGFTLTGSRTEKYLEDRYNIDMEVIPLPSFVDLAAKVSLLMADDAERPDIIWWDTRRMISDFTKWEDAGLLVDLTDYINKYTVIRDYYDSQDPRIMFYAESGNGRTYRIPGDISEPSCETLWIRKDWLDNLGLEVPKTLAELDDVLYKFTFDDPDGNGIKDTYGLGGDGYELRSFWPWLQGSGAGNNHYYFDFTKMPDGTIAYAGSTGDMKKAVERIAKLYKDGVITPNIITDTNGNEEMARGGFGVIHRWIAWNNPSGVVMRSFYASNPNAEWIPFDPVAGDNGNGQANPEKLSAWCFFAVTKNCTDPERAYAIWDDMVSPEQYILRRFGIEGEDYVTNPDGSHTILISSQGTENVERNLGINLFQDLVGRKDWCNIGNTPETVDLFTRMSNGSRDSYSLVVERKNPAIYKEWDNYGSELTDIRDAYLWSVIAGTDSINNWDRYLANLKNAGLDQVLAEINGLYPQQEKEMQAYLAARAARD
jgi:ABC-type glycerol-3-phosphate transport system substrate-binding protein